MRNFRRQMLSIAANFRLCSLRNSFSVSLSRKERITTSQAYHSGRNRVTYEWSVLVRHPSGTKYRITRYAHQAIPAAAGMVRTHAQRIFFASPHRTALMR